MKERYKVSHSVHCLLGTVHHTFHPHVFSVALSSRRPRRGRWGGGWGAGVAGISLQNSRSVQMQRLVIATPGLPPSTLTTPLPASQYAESSQYQAL